MLESDVYGGPKYRSNICSNYDEATNGMVKLAKYGGLKCFASKIIVDDVLLYGITAEQLLAYFITVLDVIKHHRDTLKLEKYKWFK